VTPRDVEKQRRKMEKELKQRQKEMERRKIKDEKKRVKEAEKAEKEKIQVTGLLSHHPARSMTRVARLFLAQHTKTGKLQ
jgi:hypothetical protein